MSDRDQVLFERALVLIMDEWGKTREEALAWLNDDATDWTPRPQTEYPAEIDGKSAFIQVPRVSIVGWPTITGTFDSRITPAMIDEMANKEEAFAKVLAAHELRAIGEDAAAKKVVGEIGGDIPARGR